MSPHPGKETAKARAAAAVSVPAAHSRLRSALEFTVLMATALLSVANLCAFLALYISPREIVFLQLVGLAFPFLAALSAVAILFWIWRRNWIFLLPLATITLNINNVSRIFAFNLFRDEPLRLPKELKVTSFNVRAFNVHKWTTDTEARDKIMAHLKATGGDVVCFQEYYHGLTRSTQTTSQILRNTAMPYHRMAVSYEKRGGYRFGVATFSRHPIVRSGQIDFRNTLNNCLWTDIKVGSDTVRVYNVHLQSNNFDPDSYYILAQINNSPSTLEAYQVSNLIGVVAAKYRQRARQAEIVASHIEASPYPVIVCADLNDTPHTYSYRVLRGPRGDAFLGAGAGLGHTFGDWLTSIRID